MKWYFIRVIFNDEQFVMVDARQSLKEIKEFERHLHDHYNVDTEIYTKEEYMKLYP